jgi:hypothetical protein
VGLGWAGRGRLWACRGSNELHPKRQRGLATCHVTIHIRWQSSNDALTISNLVVCHQHLRKAPEVTSRFLTYAAARGRLYQMQREAFAAACRHLHPPPHRSAFPFVINCCVAHRFDVWIPEIDKR